MPVPEFPKRFHVMCVWGSKHLCEGGGGGGGGEGREGIDQESVRARGRGLDH